MHLSGTGLILLFLLTICSSLPTPLSFRFTSAGFCCVAHLRSLAIEDYTLLGIYSAEESSRLSKLIRNLNVEQVPQCGQSDYEDYIDDGRDHCYFLVHDDDDDPVCTDFNDKSSFSFLFISIDSLSQEPTSTCIPGV